MRRNTDGEGNPLRDREAIRTAGILLNAGSTRASNYLPPGYVESLEAMRASTVTYLERRIDTLGEEEFEFQESAFGVGGISSARGLLQALKTANQLWEYRFGPQDGVDDVNVRPFVGGLVNSEGSSLREMQEAFRRTVQGLREAAKLCRQAAGEYDSWLPGLPEGILPDVAGSIVTAYQVGGQPVTMRNERRPPPKFKLGKEIGVEKYKHLGRIPPGLPKVPPHARASVVRHRDDADELAALIDAWAYDLDLDEDDLAEAISATVEGSAEEKARFFEEVLRIREAAVEMGYFDQDDDSAQGYEEHWEPEGLDYDEAMDARRAGATLVHGGQSF